MVDTTVQPRAIAHPTDARLCHRALQKLVELARRHGVPLRQSYRGLAKRAAIMVGRYSHAHQFKRARRALKFLRTRLGRVIRDIRRKIAGDPARQARFADLPALAPRVSCIELDANRQSVDSIRFLTQSVEPLQFVVSGDGQILESARARPARRTKQLRAICNSLTPV